MGTGYSLRLRGGRWYARYRDGNGRLREKRLHFTKDEKRKAQIYASELVSQASRVRDGLERATERITLSELWDRYRPIARKKGSWKSILGRWNNHIQPVLGKKQIDTLEAADIEALCAEVEEKPGRTKGKLSGQTAEHVRVDLSSMLSFAIRKLRVLRRENVARIAARPKIPPPRPRFIDALSLEMLLAKVPKQWAGIFAVSAYTGLRKGEVLGLQLGDIDLGRNLIWVWRSYDKNTTKGGKGRVVAFPPVLAQHLREAMAVAVEAESQWLFPRVHEGSSKRKAGKAQRGGPMGPDTKLTNVIRKALADAGIKAPAGFSYKDLRSTYGTHLAEATGDLRIVQRQLGHSSPVTTERHYAFARDRHMADQVARLPFGNLAHRLPTNPADPDQTQPTPPEPS